VEPARQGESSSVSGSAPMVSGYLSDDESEHTTHDDEHEDAQTSTSGRGTHGRAASDRGGRRSLDWVRGRQAPEPNLKKRTVIVERLETIDPKPFFSCW